MAPHLPPPSNNTTAGGGEDSAPARNEQECNIQIIDVNFFPSYKEVEDFPVRFKAYLRQRAGLLR